MNTYFTPSSMFVGLWPLLEVGHELDMKSGQNAIGVCQSQKLLRYQTHVTDVEIDVKRPEMNEPIFHRAL
eukprot:2371616-Amphidinium_carterae.1